MSDAPATVHCCRCGRDAAPALARPPMPGKLGAEIQARVCARCWGDWQGMEVMVINELRLNFMDPEAQATLTRQMREFLQLGEGPPAAGAPPPGAA